MRKLRGCAAAWLCRPSNALAMLAAFLLSLDHRWSQLTFAGLSLAAGSYLVNLCRETGD